MRWTIMTLAIFLFLPAAGNGQPLPARSGPAFREARPVRKPRSFRRIRRARKPVRRHRLAPPRLFRRAARLTPHRTRQIRDLDARITPRWLRARTELRIARRELARTLRNPDASPEELKRALHKLRERDQELHKIREEALIELRKTLEGDAFSRIVAPWPGP